jgi:hypothetical protein
MSCVVPGCNSGYGTHNKYPPGVGKHRFPKDPKLRKEWCKAIPRDDWEPTDSSRVCGLHFEDLDYEQNRKDSNKNRKKGDLKRRKLKDDAIPRIFPNCPAYLSKNRPGITVINILWQFI